MSISILSAHLTFRHCAHSILRFSPKFLAFPGLFLPLLVLTGRNLSFSSTCFSFRKNWKPPGQAGNRKQWWEGQWSPSKREPLLSLMSPDPVVWGNQKSRICVRTSSSFLKIGNKFENFKIPWGKKKVFRPDLATGFWSVTCVHNLSLMNEYLQHAKASPWAPAALPTSTHLVTSGHFHLNIQLTSQTQNWTHFPTRKPLFCQTSLF